MFKATLKLESKIFNSAARRDALSRIVYENARSFRGDLQRKMQTSIPAGQIDIVGEGTGFRARFRRSARGQRPAIQTRRLLNSFRARRTGELSAETTVIAETDEGFNYGEELQQNQNRKIMTEADVGEAKSDFAGDCSRTLIKLLN